MRSVDSRFICYHGHINHGYAYDSNRLKVKSDRYGVFCFGWPIVLSEQISYVPITIPPSIRSTTPLTKLASSLASHK